MLTKIHHQRNEPKMIRQPLTTEPLGHSDVKHAMLHFKQPASPDG